VNVQRNAGLHNKTKLARFCGILCLFWLLAPQIGAQRGTAPNGYYPPNYSGAIFTGTLESATPDTRQVTLLYVKRADTQRFLGRVESACGWKDKDGTAHTFEISDVPKGTVLTAFYESVTNKSGTQPAKENVIFAISYVELNGKKIPDEKRIIIHCSSGQFVRFKAF